MRALRTSPWWKTDGGSVMKRVMFAVVAAMLTLGLMAGPASAGAVGVIIGAQANVSKANVGGCAVPNSGAGIGLPIINGVKKAYYSFTTDNGATGVGAWSSGNAGSGTLNVCGQIDPVGVPPAQVGAACGMSAGNNGVGNGTIAGQGLSLSDVGWKASAASFFVVTGNAQTAKKGHHTVVALVSARGTGSTCAEKRPINPLGGIGDSKTGGAEQFVVDIVFTLLPIPKQAVLKNNK